MSRTLNLPLTPGAYLKRRRQAAGLSVGDVAAMLVTEPRLAEFARAEWLDLIEADVSPAAFSTIVALRTAFRFDLEVLERLVAIQLGSDLPPHDLCRICACSRDCACRDSSSPFSLCWRIQPDLCSACDFGPPAASAPIASNDPAVIAANGSVEAHAA